MSENMDNFILGFITGLNVRGTLHKAEVLPDKPVEAAYYLYGTPSESGNVALADGDGYTLYNGVILPPLPSDAVQPYALIYTGSNGVYLICADNYWFGYNYTESNDYNDPTEVYMNPYEPYKLVGGAWERQNWVGVSAAKFDKLNWANFDIINKDSSVYLPDATPIPLVSNEPVGYTDNNIPIYETTLENGRFPEAPDTPDTPACYLYGTPYGIGTPYRSGNVALADGDGYELFSGVALPPVPEWDEETYPYAYITYDMWGNIYFHATDVRPYIKGTNMAAGSRNEIQTVLLNDGTWREPFSNSNQGIANSMFVPFWTNFDLLAEDGSVHQPAIMPIPLASNEPISYTDDNIPIYEMEEHFYMSILAIAAAVEQAKPVVLDMTQFNCEGLASLWTYNDVAFYMLNQSLTSNGAMKSYPFDDLKGALKAAASNHAGKTLIMRLVNPSEGATIDFPLMYAYGAEGIVNQLSGKVVTTVPDVGVIEVTAYIGFSGNGSTTYLKIKGEIIGT